MRFWIQSVHKNVIGYGNTPIANIIGISNPKKLNPKSKNFDVPNKFNIVIEDMKIADKINKIILLLFS